MIVIHGTAVSRKLCPTGSRPSGSASTSPWDGEGEQRHPVLVVGPYPIDLVTATEAAARLQCDTYEALHADEGNPWPRGWAYEMQHGTAPGPDAGSPAEVKRA